MRQVGAILVGLFTGFFMLILIVALGTTSLHVYTVNTFHNCIMLFTLLVTISLSTEFVLDSQSKECFWDELSALVISIVTIIILNNFFSLPFTGESHLIGMIKKLWIPIVLQIVVALLGSSGISKLIEKSKK